MGTINTALVFKSMYVKHLEKLTFVRVLAGEISDGMRLNTFQVSGVSQIFGQKFQKVSIAIGGEIVALGRMEGIHTGDTLT